MTSKPVISKDLQELILAIGHSKSREEEACIMQEEIQLLREDLRTPGVTPATQAELMIRILYLQLLGFDAGFAYISAINLSQHSNQRVKRLGYLVCCTCLSQDSELLTLLVSSLQRDLVSPDPLCVCAALTALTKVSTTTMIHALVDTVLQLLRHSLPIVRSKAAMALTRFMSVESSIGTLAEPHVNRLLMGDDLTCLMCALNFYEAFYRQCPSIQPYRHMVKPLTLIIRSLTTRHIPDTYYFYSSPAPWIQVQAMKVLSLIGNSEPSMCIQIANVLLDVLRRATAQLPPNNINQALIYQAHVTAAGLRNCEMVLSRSSEYLSSFLGRGNSNNLLYAGVVGLMKSFKSEPDYIFSHQLRVMDFLEDSDETLRNGTLKVLMGITRAHNVEVIVTKVVSVIPRIQEEYVRADLIQKVASITDLYAPNGEWKFDVHMQLLSLYSKKNEWTNTFETRIIKELLVSDSATIQHALLTSKSILDFNPEDQQSNRLKIAIWTIGEFSQTQNSEISQELFTSLSSLLNISFSDSTVTQWLLTALQKTLTLPLTQEFKSKLSECAASRDTEIQQRCYEMARMCQYPEAPRVQPGSFECDFGQDLGFLESYGQSFREKSNRMYAPVHGACGGVGNKGKIQEKELKFSYGQTIAPQLAYVMPVPAKTTQGTGSSTLLGQLWGLFGSAK